MVELKRRVTVFTLDLLRTNCPPISITDIMCKSQQPLKKEVRAGNSHEESGGFHVVELNSPINVSGSTLFFLFLLASLVLGIYLYYRDRKNEKKRARREEKEEREGRERAQPRAAPAPQPDINQLIPLLNLVRSQSPVPVQPQPSLYPALPAPYPAYNPYAGYQSPPFNPNYCSPSSAPVATISTQADVHGDVPPVVPQSGTRPRKPMADTPRCKEWQYKDDPDL